MNSIMKRRSIRKYQYRPVEAEKIERILRAAMQSPTGHNTQDWEFIVVTEPEMRKTVSELGPYSAFAAAAPVQIAVCANREKAWPGGSWPGNMGAVSQTILLQVEEEGLGACWIGVWPYEERMAHVRAALGIPGHVIPYSVIAIGYKEYEKRFDDRYDAAKVHWEKY